MKLRVLDLFSGIGGFSLGLERTGGFETVAFCEIEDYPRRVLAKHWPKVPCYHDVRDLTADTLARVGIAVDVICGGFPCQDISFAGKGAGLAGERSGLWREYARLVGELRPRFVIVENVAALLGRGLGVVLGNLAALGYDAEWHCIPASCVGAPHRRDRLWLVAYAGGKQHEGYSAALRGALAAQLHGTDPDTAPMLGQAEQRGEPNGDHERAQDVADADKLSRHQGRTGDAPQGSRGRNADRSRERSEVRHADAVGCARVERQAQAWEAGAACGPDWWLSEPGVGGGPDGFPVWLDRCIGEGLSHAESGRRVQVLRGLWSSNVSQALWRAAGGLERLSAAEVLFSFVREYEAGSDEARLLVAGKKASEEFLRGLRERGFARSAPHRPRPKKQQPVERPDAVQPVPRLLARDSEADWSLHSWEDAVPRVANGVPSRVDRLRGLGNAVVPQIPELIGRAILQAEGLAA